MLVILRGLGKVHQNVIYRHFRTDAKNTVWIYSGRTSKEFQGLPANRQISFTNDDYNELRRRFPEVPYLAGRVYLSGNQILRYKDKNLNFDVRAVHPDKIFIENINIQTQIFINVSNDRQT